MHNRYSYVSIAEITICLLSDFYDDVCRNAELLFFFLHDFLISLRESLHSCIHLQAAAVLCDFSKLFLLYIMHQLSNSGKSFSHAEYFLLFVYQLDFNK